MCFCFNLHPILPTALRMHAEFASNSDSIIVDTITLHGQGSFPFQMKWRVSISWSRFYFTNLTVYRVFHHLKF